MKRFLLFALCAVVSCGGQVAADTGDAGADTTSGADTFEFPLDAPPPLIDVSPRETCAGAAIDLRPKDAVVVIDASTTPPTVATQSYTATLIGCAGPKDVTAEVALSLADPSLGAFVGNRFTSASSLPDGEWIARTTVHASAESTFGTGALAVVQMRVDEPRADALFSVGECSTKPARFVLKTKGGGTPSDLSTTTTNDPKNDFDATTLLAPVRAMTEGDAASGCAPHAGVDTNGDGIVDSFTAVAGETVCFEVTPHAGIAHTASIDVVAAFVDVVAASDSSFRDHRVVIFELLPIGGPPC